MPRAKLQTTLGRHPAKLKPEAVAQFRKLRREMRAWAKGKSPATKRTVEGWIALLEVLEERPHDKALVKLLAENRSKIITEGER